MAKKPWPKTMIWVIVINAVIVIPLFIFGIVMTASSVLDKSDTEDWRRLELFIGPTWFVIPSLIVGIACSLTLLRRMWTRWVYTITIALAAIYALWMASVFPLALIPAILLFIPGTLMWMAGGEAYFHGVEDPPEDVESPSHVESEGSVDESAPDEENSTDEGVAEFKRHVGTDGGADEVADSGV